MNRVIIKQMKGIKLAKRIIISLLILLSASIFAIIPIKLNHITPEETKKNTPSGTYTFTESEHMSYDDYLANSEFVINDEAGWRKFCIAGNWQTILSRDENNEVVSNTVFYYWEDKVIKLNANITITQFRYNEFGIGQYGYYHAPDIFKGTFDGQCNTISFNLDSNNSHTVDDAHILFNKAQGTIKNLIIKNAYLYTESTSRDAVIARQNSGSIENCIVENCKFLSNRYKSYLDVASIAANNTGTVKNCIVTGKYEIGGKSWNFASNSDGCYAYYFVASGYAAINSIFVATVSKFGDYTKHCIAPSEHDSLAGNFSSYASAYESMTADVSTTSGEEGTAWFKYISGCGYNKDTSIPVYLRAFIDWSTIVFEAETGGMVSSRSIDVPADYISATENGANITIYDKTITATVTNELYGFASDIWTGSGVRYTANFVQKYIYASFLKCEVAENFPSKYGPVIVDYINGQAQVAFSYMKSSGVLRADCYKDGTYLETIEYGNVAPEYVYKGLKISQQDNIISYQPYAQIKNYKVNFG